MMDTANLKPATEQFEHHYTFDGRMQYTQYDYRCTCGTLFSCVAMSLDLARIQCDHWMRDHRKLAIAQQRTAAIAAHAKKGPP